MRKPTLAVVLLTLWSCSPEALEALERHAEQINELSHHVKVRFVDGAARLTVTRKFRNDTLQYEELNRQLLLPEGAIATSLRVSDGTGAPISATLTTTEEAAARWDMLTRFGEAAPSLVSKLDWGSEGELAFSLFGLAPGDTATVEYELELRPEYFAGELSFVYPLEDEGHPAPTFQGGTALVDTEVGYKLRQSNDFAEPFTARWATYPLEVNRSLWRLELDVKAQLGETPVRPNVVFVIDASHSEGPEGIAAQLELIEPYLANVREAQVELVIYRRFAERVFGRFVPGNDVQRLLATIAPERFAPANGSNLELGARLAAEALAQAGGVNSRVVLFTDEQVSFAFTNERAIEALSLAPRDTIVHLVHRASGNSGELDELRDDNSELAPIAAATGGVFFRIYGRPLDPVLSSDTMLGLVRPVRIDALEITADELGMLNDTSTLHEGSAIRRMEIDKAPDEIVVTGKLWARELRQVLHVDHRLADQLPGLSIGNDSVRWTLSDDELRTVAYVSHAVSPVTSFFSAPPEAAASTVGRIGGLGCFGVGVSSHCGGVGGTIGCGIGHAKQGPDFDALLRGLIAPVVNACRQHGDPSLAKLQLEATGDEIVAINVTAEPGLAECLTEGIWQLRLSSDFYAHRIYGLDSLE